MIYFLLGAIMVAEFVAALIFLRFWRRTHDRLFAFFAGAFALEGISRICMSATDPYDEGGTLVYVIRIVAYALIVVAIAGKNRSKRT